MEGRSKEDTRKTSSPPCQNPSSPNCNFCGRTKRKISHAYGRSISFPPSSSPAHHRPSPALFRSMSDVSPLPSPLPALWNQIPATPTTSPPVPTSPAPVPPAVKISPETKTIPCKNADVSLAYPASETVSASLDPNPDSDPPTEEVMAKELRRLREQQAELKKEMERFAETPMGKIVLGGALTENDNNNNNNNTASQELQRLREQQVELKKEMERFAETPEGKIVSGRALTENNNNNNNTASNNNNNNNNTASQVHEELTTGSGGGKLEISFACPCGKSVTVVSSGGKLEFSCVCTVVSSGGKLMHNVVFT